MPSSRWCRGWRRFSTPSCRDCRNWVIAYRGSPIVEGAGERYFDDSLRGGGIRSRFLLLCHADTGGAIQAAIDDLIAAFSDVVERRASTRHEITLVRPDGYIAYSGDSRDGIAAVRAVRAVLESQTASGDGAVALAGTSESVG